MKREHLRQLCQEPLGFILAWPRKISWKRTRGPRALWSAVSQLQSGDCQVLQWLGRQALRSRLGGDYQPDPLSWEPAMTPTSQQPGPAREGDNEHWRGLSPPRWCLFPLLAAVADPGQCTACEVIWIPWQPASTWILSKPQESSREKVNIPSEPVLISKEGYWRRNWGWGGRARHYKCIGVFLNFHRIMWLRQTKVPERDLPGVLSPNLHSVCGALPPPWRGTFTSPRAGDTSLGVSDNTFGFQLNFVFIVYTFYFSSCSESLAINSISKEGPIKSFRPHIGST